MSIKKVIRYIGAKEKVLPFLKSGMLDNFTHRFDDESFVFVDGFSGTGIVSQWVRSNTNWKIIAGDISKYSEVLGTPLKFKYTLGIDEYIKHLDTLAGVAGIVFNELSIEGVPSTVSECLFNTQEFASRMFFSKEVGQKIDAIREALSSQTDPAKKAYGYYFLLAFADKNANTTSVYGAYLKNENKKFSSFYQQELADHLLTTDLASGGSYEFRRESIDVLLSTLPKADLVYLDPPYNTRRYESNYHILNYLVDPSFCTADIKHNSKTAMPAIASTNPFGSKKETQVIFDTMLKSAISLANQTYISYNDEGTMTFTDVKALCDKYGASALEIAQDYKRYKSGANDSAPLVQELIWKITNDITTKDNRISP